MADTEEIVFIKPAATGGAYRDEEFIKSYWELVTALHELVPSDRSNGSLQIGGVGAMCRARCANIVAKAKSMEQVMKAVTIGRK